MSYAPPFQRVLFYYLQIKSITLVMIINSSILSSSFHFHYYFSGIFPIEMHGMPHATIA